MENENEHAQEEIVEQEEQISEEQDIELESQDEDSDEVTLSKSEYKKLNYKAKAYDATKDTKTEKPTATKTEAVQTNSDERYERLALQVEQKFSPEEVDAIMELGGVNALKNPIVQNAIKAMRAEKKSKDASTDVSSKSPVYKKFTQEDFGKMSAAEMEKILRE